MNNNRVRIYMHPIPLVGTISYYCLPDGSMVYRPASDEGRIDFEPLRPYVGTEVEIWRDGGLEEVSTLTGFTEVEGVPALVFQPSLDI